MDLSRKSPNTIKHAHVIAKINTDLQYIIYLDQQQDKKPHSIWSNRQKNIIKHFFSFKYIIPIWKYKLKNNIKIFEYIIQYNY